MTPEDDLLEKARALPRSVPPARDLWPGIAARLDPRETTVSSTPAVCAVDDARAARRVRRWQLLALAAGLVLAVTLVSWLGREPGSTTPELADMPTGPATRAHAVTTLHTAVQRPAADLHTARLALAGSIERRLDGLGPTTRQVVLDNLATINRALDDIDAALAAAPESDPEARLLMAVYADQLMLLNTMNNAMNNALYTASPEIAL